MVDVNMKAGDIEKNEGSEFAGTNDTRDVERESQETTQGLATTGVAECRIVARNRIGAADSAVSPGSRNFISLISPRVRVLAPGPCQVPSAWWSTIEAPEAQAQPLNAFTRPFIRQVPHLKFEFLAKNHHRCSQISFSCLSYAPPVNDVMTRSLQSPNLVVEEIAIGFSSCMTSVKVSDE